MPITFLQYNVLYKNDDIDAIAQVVLDADADVVALHELTLAQWEPLQERLADRYPHQLVLAYDPNSEAVSKGGGKAILSAAPLTSVAFDLPAEFTPPLAATTTIDGRETLVVALHPSPSRTSPRRIYHRKAKLQAVTDMVADYDGPAVIIADLNIAPTSPDYGSFLDDLGWDDPRRTVGIIPTYFVRGSRIANVAIDHVFVSPEFTVHDYDVGPRGGSDHLSLVATVSWR